MAAIGKFIAYFFLVLSAVVLLAGFEPHLSTSQLRNLVISGIVGLVIGDTFLFKAYESVGARTGMLIMSAAPAMSALLAYLLLGEILGSMGFIGMAVTLFGIALVVLEQRASSSVQPGSYSKGIMYALLSAFLVAAYSIMSKFLIDGSNGYIAFGLKELGLLFGAVPAIYLSRKEIKGIFSENKTTAPAIIASSVLGVTAGLLIILAFEQGTVTLSSALSSVQPLFVLAFVFLMSKFMPGKINEETGAKPMLVKLEATILIVAGAIMVA